MKDTPIVLSISMLISGKEDMPKSLESLHYFKDAFPCEIILVDTGCTAEQRALAEGIADKIIDFKWCNDFAAARNVGIEASCGEWFMYLDDDEWFENPREIVDFFLSGEYKKYNSASYVVRNYSDMRGIMYDDSYPSRMVKLEPGVRFVGKIHEYLEPFKLPKKTFSDFVHHYGYADKGEEEGKAHAYRNIRPLEEMRKEHPGDPRWIGQLAQEYFAIKDYKKTIQVCLEGLEEWKDFKDRIDYAPSHIGAVYGYILISLESLKEFQEEEIWLGKALAEPLFKLKVMEPTAAFFCMAGARLYSHLENDEMCHKYFSEYIEYTERLKGDRTIIEAGAAAIVAGVFQEQLLYGAILISLGSVIRMQDYGLAERAFFMLDWLSDRRLLQQSVYETKITDACCSVAYHPTWVKLLQTLVSREDGMKEMYVVFLNLEITYKRQGNMEKLLRLRRLVSETEFEHRYILCTRILWTSQNSEISSEEERVQRVQELFEQLFEKYSHEILEIKEEIWSVAERFGMSLEKPFLRMNYHVWKRGLEHWSLEVPMGSIRHWEDRIESWKQQENIRYDYFSIKCMEAYLRQHQKNNITLEQMEDLLWRYADGVLSFYQPLFKEFVFTEMTLALPDEAQLALALKKLQGYREQGDDLKTLESLRGCLGLYPALEDVTDTYASRISEQIKKKNMEAAKEQSELAGLIAALKVEAKRRIESEEYQGAKEILIQVQQCAPGDEEVQELLNQIEAKQ